MTKGYVRALDPAKGITLGEAREGDSAIKTGGWGRKRPFWEVGQSSSEESADV